MIVEYIYNSCFSLETEDRFLVFDYYKGDLKIPEDKELIFFVSHGHYDHYNEAIFNYRDRASYILSFDLGFREEKGIIPMEVDQELKYRGLYVRALGSTDQGLSYYLELDGLKIFHAGDLNWWAWEDQGPEKEVERERNFKREVDKLEGKKLDIVFAPLDPRLGHNYHKGACYYIERLEPRYFFPMHFREDYSPMEKFKDLLVDSSSRFMAIEKPNKRFYLDL